MFVIKIYTDYQNITYFMKMGIIKIVPIIKTGTISQIIILDCYQFQIEE